MINHILSPEPQKVFATEQSAGITNLDTVPMLPPELASAYGYADLRDKLTQGAPAADAADRARPMGHL